MARHKDASWDYYDRPPIDHIQAALLQDLRDELKEIKRALVPLRHLECVNFLSIPSKLDLIAKHTRKPRRRRR